MSTTSSVNERYTAPAGTGLARLRAIAVAERDRIGAAVAIGLVVGIGNVVRLGQFPAPWFDEGIHLQVARNLITDGTYAARAADGTLDYAPAIGVGPTLLLPVAAALELGGHGLVAARIVPVIYLAIATALLYLIGRTLFSRVAAIATVILVLTMPAIDWVETGRQVLGEVPALVFLLLGGLLVSRARRLPGLIGAGAVLGLAMVTKGQYVLILPVTLLALAAVDWRWTGHRPLRWHATLFVTVCATWALWIATLLLLIGDGNIAENVELLRESSSGALLVLDPGRIVAALKVVLGPSTLLIVVLAALAGLVAIFTASGDRRFALLGLWLFQAAWLGWFVVGSIGWPRYAFAGLVVNAIFAGYLVDHLVQLARSSRRDHPQAALAARVIGAALVLLVLAGGWRTLAPVVRNDDNGAAEFASLLETSLPEDAVVHGWEPEIGFLSDSLIQPPPPGSLNAAVRARWFGDPAPDYSTDLNGDYLMIGPFGSWTGVYQTALDSGRWEPMFQVGAYELFGRHD